MTRFLRRARLCLSALFLLSAPARAADPPAFDLPGPELKARVTRGKTTLPIGAVPGLAAGDVLTIGADLPADQRARYLLVSAFLSGATNPPPRKWITAAETWKRKDKDKLLKLTVPEGARQMVLFLVPDTGGAEGAIADAVRARPGEFVRATQGLNQASLDRSRLNAFMAAIRAQENTHPEYLRSIAPTLARSLAIKLNDDCLARVVEMQAACLLENRDALVLADIHSSSMTETLVGAPSDLALQLSYTREGGLGYYSPYIAVVRDLARVFGAFNNPELNYLPTLSAREGERVALLLNAAPSFGKPKSVLVAAMPVIGADSMPRLRSGADQPLCGVRPDLVLPVEGAPLVYSTGYAHDMVLRLTDQAGHAVEVPVTARADRGGYVPGKPLPALSGAVTAQLHGRWGFEAMAGPSFDLRFPGGEGWRSRTSQLVIGRNDAVTFTGGSAACVSGVMLRDAGGATRPLTWKVTGDDRIEAVLPLAQARPGDVTVEVRQYGAAPATIALKAYDQASRIDAVTWHRGDRGAVLTGQRLDQVASVEVGAVRFIPDGLSREGDSDVLRIKAAQAIADLGDAPAARIALRDGRVLDQAVRVAPPRPSGTLLTRALLPDPGSDGLSLVPTDPQQLPDGRRLAFSLKAPEGVEFAAQDAIEVATDDERHRVILAAGSDVRLQSAEVLVATLDPAKLGATAMGPLKYRVVGAGAAGDWQPLVTLVRMPHIAAVECPGGQSCTLRGRDLFLIAAVAPDAAFARAVTVPEGQAAATLAVPPPVDGQLFLRLRDAPAANFTLALR